MAEVQTLLDIAIDYYVENKDSIQRFCWLDSDLQNTIVKRECGDLATRRIGEANMAEQDSLFIGAYIEGPDGKCYIQHHITSLGKMTFPSNILIIR